MHAEADLSARDLNVDALVHRTLALVVHHTDAPDLRGVFHVGTAVRLQVEADDLDGPDLLNSRRQ